MSGLVTITYEGKSSIEDIQKKFRANLSEKEILKTTARAINETARKVQGFIRQGVRKEYTVKNKYLMKASYVSKMASGVSNRLYANVNFSYRPIKMTGFKFTGKPNGKRLVTITIRKGKTITLRHAFVRAKSSIGSKEAYGIYLQGRYLGKRFVYEKDGKKISELKTASPYAMSMSKEMQPKINEYVARELPVKLQVFLQMKVDKMKRTAIV